MIFIALTVSNDVSCEIRENFASSKLILQQKAETTHSKNRNLFNQLLTKYCKLIFFLLIQKIMD